MVRRNSINILSCKYDIEYSNVIHMEGEDGRCVAGQILHEQQIIRVREAHPEYMQNTFLHEVLHGITYAMNIDGDNVEEEDMVRGLTTGLLAVMRDNDWSPLESLTEPKKKSKKVE